MSLRARPPAVAGLFYPAEPDELAALVDRLLQRAGGTPGSPVRAVVAPHAGYAYSGHVAAAAYAAVRGRAPGTRRIVLLGPSHFVPLQGAAVPTTDAWTTPLGAVPVAGDLRDAALQAGAFADDAPHEQEHALEVQLPFLQRALPGPPPVLPVAIGEMPAVAVAGLIGALAGAQGTLVVVSTDLSHYLDDARARATDRETATAILALRPDAIGDRAACGAYALRGLLEHARLEGLRAEQLALATSADATGDRSRVVGYGAFALAPLDG